MLLIESVVSLPKRAAIASLAGSLLRRLANSVSFHLSRGRERHVGAAREGNLPYPMRALRTKDFLYVRNFAPERWPMGAPYAVTETSEPSVAELETDTRIAFPDMDASPTKAWLIAHRHEAQGKGFYDRAFGKRPGEELY